jgi:hypothetical protein
MGQSVRCCVGKPPKDEYGDGDIADLTNKKPMAMDEESIHVS